MKTKENTLSSVTSGMENILEAAGIVTNSPILLLAALVPSMVKTSLLKKDILKTEMPEKLQKQLLEVIVTTIKRCEEELQSTYLAKKLQFLKTHVTEFDYENISYDSIQNWINCNLREDMNYHN